MLLLSLLFAVHTFLLMGTGTWSDLAMAGEDFATTLYYVREGVLAAGFLMYAAFAQRKKSHPLSQKAADIADISLLVLFAVCILVLHVSSLPALRVSAILVVALIIGISGGMVYERIALSAFQLGNESGLFPGREVDATRALGLIIGCGGALAVALLFALQTGFSIGGWLNFCFVVCFGLLMWLARKEHLEATSAQAGKDVSSNGPAAVPFACMVIAVICLFALLLFYAAAIRASDAGTSVFYEWYRLFLAAGYIVIGAVAYVRGRSAASVAIVVFALFAIVVSVQTAMLEAGPFTTILFYFLLGAMLAWSAIVFMSAAAHSAYSAFVASAWRVLAELVTLAESLILIVGELSLMAVLTGSLILLAVVVLAMVKGGFLVFQERSSESPELTEEESALSAEERMHLLARECGLTDREYEVFAALVLTEKKNQQIADDMGISRRQLQNYVFRIYEKTDTTTRAGLVMRVNGEA